MIIVNNKEEIEWHEGMTVRELLAVCRFTSPKIAVFVDGQLVRPEVYDTFQISDGAQVKALHFIAGG